jgi:hypothetical protein
LERTIHIPQPTDRPELSPIIVSRAIEKNPSPEKTHRPFQFGTIHIAPSATNAFLPGDKMYACFKLYGLTEELEQIGFFEFIIFKEDQQVRSSRANIKDYDGTETFLAVISLADLSPGHYRLEILLRDESQKEIGKNTESFVITPMASLPRYWSVAEVLPRANDPFYSFILGTQMHNQGELGKAVLLLEMAYSQRPASFEFAVALADTYYVLGEHRKVQELMSRFLEKAKEEPLVFQLLGTSCFEAGDYGRAIYYLKKYLTQFGSNIAILNALAECYAKTGQLEEALAAWEKSLELDATQDEIRAKITSLKENK